MQPETMTEEEGSRTAEAQPRCAPAAGSARTMTDEQAKWLLEQIETIAKLKESDNKKLLWLAMNTAAWKSLDVMGLESEIFAEIENRLYPEYDGETVTFEDWGWKTPDGELRYLPNKKLTYGSPTTTHKRK